MDFPTVIYGLLFVRCINDLITSNNTPIIITINHIIDMIRHIKMLGHPLGIVDQLNRNHKISSTKTALIKISTNSNLTIASLFHSSTKHISISCKNNSN